MEIFLRKNSWWFDYAVEQFRDTKVPPHGDVKVSTGILKCDKRVEMGNLFNNPHFKLNANDNLALAA